MEDREDKNMNTVKLDVRILEMWRQRLSITEVRAANAVNLLSVIQDIEAVLAQSQQQNQDTQNTDADTTGAGDGVCP